MKGIQVVQFLVVLAFGIFCVHDFLRNSQTTDFFPVECDCSDARVEIVDLTSYLEGRENEFQEKYRTPLFFVETSKNGDLGPRQMCTVESFSQLNPDIQVVVVFEAQYLNSSTNRAVDELVKHNDNKNVILASVDSERAFATSESFKDVFSEAANSKFHLQHLSDFLRLLLVWKLGGMYMDLDIIHFRSLKPFFNQKINFVTPVAPYAMNNNFFGFSRGHPVLLELMEALRKRYNASEYVGGPRSIDTVLSKMANKSITEVIAEGKVGDVIIPPYWLVSPVHSSNFKMLFTYSANVTEFLALAENSFAVHFWNHQSHGFRLNPKFIFVQLAQQFCPKSFWSRHEKINFIGEYSKYG